MIFKIIMKIYLTYTFKLKINYIRNIDTMMITDY